jgi:uncharacterized protein
MGSGTGLSCDISLNTVLNEEQRAIYQNPATIQRILDESKTIGIYGLSADPQKASYFVASYLKAHGYRIVPINPNATEILGEKCYPDIASVPDKLDMLDIFRRASDVPPLIDAAIEKKIPVVWLQLRIINLPAAEKARAAGLTVILDKCVKMEHGRYKGGLNFAGMNTEIISARREKKA